MRRRESGKLVLLTLSLESAVESEDWLQVNEILAARAAILASIPTLPGPVLDEIAAIEERTLTLLRTRLMGVRADLRNLSAALKLATAYRPRESVAGLSLAG